MNKKILWIGILIVIVVVIASIILFSKKENITDEDTNITNTTNGEKTDQENEVDEEWGVTDNFAACANNRIEGFYINFPALTGIPKGTGLVAYQPDGSFVIVDSQNLSTTIEIDNVKDVLPAYFEQTKSTMKLYRGIAYDDFEFEIKSKNNVTINDYEMCKYEGIHTFTLNDELKAFNFVAYSTQLKSNGAYIYWMVLDETGDQRLGETIAEHAKNMAYSLSE